MRRQLIVVPLALAGGLVLAACGSSTPTTTTVPATTTVPVTTTTVAVTRNLVVTPAVRQSLVAAGAALHKLPTSDYVGLRAGETYYAFDPATNTYYAAASLDPSPSSYPAQVGSQDDGAYNLFTRMTGVATWTVYNDGLGGVQGAICPVTLPASVLAVWSWKPHSCYPPPAG
ncbi:MAG: hypothetical protein ACHQFZ_01665 [Acidimicrobiales bacterium]